MQRPVERASVSTLHKQVPHTRLVVQIDCVLLRAQQYIPMLLLCGVIHRNVLLRVCDHRRHTNSSWIVSNICERCQSWSTHFYSCGHESWLECQIIAQLFVSIYMRNCSRVSPCYVVHRYHGNKHFTGCVLITVARLQNQMRRSDQNWPKSPRLAHFFWEISMIVRNCLCSSYGDGSGHM